MITDKKTFYLSLAVLLLSLSGLTPFWKLTFTLLITLTLMALSVKWKLPAGLPKKFLQRGTQSKVEHVVTRPVAHQDIVKKEVVPLTSHKEVVKKTEPTFIERAPVVTTITEPKIARLKKVVKHPRKRVIKKKTSSQTDNPEIRF